VLFGSLLAAQSADAASTWLLNNSRTGSGPNIALGFGQPGDIPIAGDWNGDGADTPGVFRPRAGTSPLWILSNSTTGGGPLVVFAFGNSAGIPFAGDWNGDGRDTVGYFLYTPQGPAFRLALSNTAGGWPANFVYGVSGDLPVVGDWDADGVDTVGVVRQGNSPLTAPAWYLAKQNVAGSAAFPAFTFGARNDKRLAGDWNGDRYDTVGVFNTRSLGGKGPTWTLATFNTTGGGGPTTFNFGTGGDVPVTGDWDADGIDTPALFRASVPFAANTGPNGVNASRNAKLTARFKTTRRKTKRMGFRSSPTLSGKLVNEHGTAIAGASITVLARRKQAGATAAPIGIVRTTGDGSFAYQLPSGPSRTVTFTYRAVYGDTQPSAQARLHTSVPARLTVNARQRAGRRLRLSGRLRFLARAHVQVNIQARDRGRWRTIDQVKTRVGGRYTWHYRFKPNGRGLTFAFRVRVDSPIYPFAPGHSRAVRVSVR